MDKGKIVLVVDDDDSLRRLVCISLQRAGFNVLEAANIILARDVWLNRNTAIDLLITDISMPDGDGVALARELQREKPGLPIIICSGNDPDSYSEELRLIPGCVALPKPCTAEKLVVTARALLQH
jgi:two-component system, cell cycle sensor histidine kinase and response regulator CckA